MSFVVVQLLYQLVGAFKPPASAAQRLEITFERDDAQAETEISNSHRLHAL